jgi:hypothetical protein
LNVKNAEKKLREASFFLTKMIRHEHWTFVVFGDKEYFDILVRFSMQE